MFQSHGSGAVQAICFMEDYEDVENQCFYVVGSSLNLFFGNRLPDHRARWWFGWLPKLRTVTPLTV